MTANVMIQRLKDKFSDAALRSAVELHTNYQKWDIEDLTQEELTALYQRFCPQKSPAEKVFELEVEKKVKSLRAIILTDATYIGMLEPNNWKEFNAWMLNLSPLKKPLNDYKINEFGDLIKQFKSLKTKYNQRAKIPFTKEWYHKNKMPMPSEN